MTVESQKSVEKSSKPAIGSPEWVKNWMHERKVHRMSKAESLKDLAAYLKDLGYKYIRVWYEGAGDSGECFHAEGWKKEINLETKDHRGSWPDVYQSKPYNYNKKEDFDEWEGMTRNQRDLEKSYNLFRKNHPDQNLDSELHYELTNLIDYDWYNNEGGQGEVVWDCKQPDTWYGDEVYER